MTTKPRRRWFRFAFTLRTMFVLVTVFACWLGWQVSVVAERKRLFAESTTDEFIHGSDGPAFFDVIETVPSQHWLRRWLGDKAYGSILLQPAPGTYGTDQAKRPSVDEVQAMRLHNRALADRYKKLFPEADIWFYKPSKSWGNKERFSTPEALDQWLSIIEKPGA